MLIFTDDFFPVEGLKTVFPLSTNTTFTNSKLDTLHHRSNTLISKKMQDHLTSYYGVIRHGMTHLAIPNGWSWGGPVSPYCPTWTEFFLYSNPDTALWYFVILFLFLFIVDYFTITQTWYYQPLAVPLPGMFVIRL